MCERHRLLNQLYAYDFALNDLNLYLDSHPTCQHALAYYREVVSARAQVVSAYTAQFGPLCITQNTCPDRWTWVDGPWPWELEG